MKKVLAIFIVLILAACAEYQAPLVETPYATESQEPKLFETFTPVPTITVIRSLTATSHPQITATRFPMHELTPTRTPLPTLERVEAERVVQQYLRDNGGCRLPCWWGITPGFTQREEAVMILEPIAKFEESSYEEKVYFGYQLLHAPEGAEVSGSLNFKNDKVSYIYVFQNGTEQSFKLHQLLSAYGKPDEIRLQAYRETFDERPPFTMLLIYRSQGIVAEFLTSTMELGQYLKGCFRNGPDLWLYDPKDSELSELEFFYPKTRAGHFEPPVLSIEQATGLNIEAFYQRYWVSGDHCVYTPSSLWPDMDQIIMTATAE